MKGPKIFKKREALETCYIPDELPHRDQQIAALAKETASSLKGGTPSNVLCFGKTGTGKTATVRYVSQKLANQSIENKPWWIYINCSIVNTPYRILAHIYNTICGKEKIPPTGLPKDVIFKKLLGLLDNKIGRAVCFLVLDEIDIIVEKGNEEILYDLTRLNENLDHCRTALIGISNKLKFTEKLDPRINSSMGEIKIVFHSYNAKELKDILNDRAKTAFYEECLDEEVIPLCAALAAKEDGDARKALQLLKKAGELAERNKSNRIKQRHVNLAVNELERDHILEYIKGLPLQSQITLTAIYLLKKFCPDHIIISGDIYSVYNEISGKIPGIKRVSKRRISDFINELDQAGIISATIKSMGRYGRTKIIELEIDMEIVEKVLTQIPKIENFIDYKPILLQSDKVKVNDNVFKKLI